MTTMVGLVSANYNRNTFDGLTEDRPVASLPFGGRYRLVDFPLSNMVNSGIITVGQNLEIDVIAAVVIGGVAMSGGKGSVVGAFIGAVLMGAITNAMTLMRIQSEWQFVVKGLIIIAAVAGGALSERLTQAKAVRAQKAA